MGPTGIFAGECDSYFINVCHTLKNLCLLQRNKFMMLPWIMLAIMIAIGGLISIIWTAAVLYNSDLDSSVTTATLLLVFGLLGVGKYIDKLQCQIQRKFEKLKAVSSKTKKACM
jgi:hypothetical protein